MAAERVNGDESVGIRPVPGDPGGDCAALVNETGVHFVQPDPRVAQMNVKIRLVPKEVAWAMRRGMLRPGVKVRVADVMHLRRRLLVNDEFVWVVYVPAEASAKDAADAVSICCLRGFCKLFGIRYENLLAIG